MLEEQFKNTLKQLILSQRTVDAIKLIRNYTGMGLQESKDLFDLFYQNLNILDNYEFKNQEKEMNVEVKISKNDLDESILYEIKKLLADDNKSYAASYLKEIKNISLQNAMEVVKEIENSGKSTIDFTLIENEDLIIDSEISNPIQTIPYEKEIKKKNSLDTGIPSIPTLHSVLKHKTKMPSSQTSTQPIVFAKIEQRERNRKKSRSNSGCMVMLAFLIFIGFVIVSIIF